VRPQAIVKPAWVLASLGVGGRTSSFPHVRRLGVESYCLTFCHRNYLRRSDGLASRAVDLSGQSTGDLALRQDPRRIRGEPRVQEVGEKMALEATVVMGCGAGMKGNGCIS
jgi:hypothetical protein